MSGPVTAAHEWDVWSTRARVVVTDPDVLDGAVAHVGRILDAVDAAASRFRDDSEVRRLRPGPDGSVSVSPLLGDLLRQALAAAEETDGAVDPTVGATLSDLGYDRDIRLVHDGDRMVARVRPVPGWRRLHLEGRRLALPPGIDLDLGATAKAAAADRAAAEVAATLGCGVLVALGGDIATAGPAPAGDWQVDVCDGAGQPRSRVSLPGGAALATSSTLRRTWRRGGRTVHHIVDPRTGRPADAVWRTVSVAHTTCVAANSAATAAIVLGTVASAWLGERQVAARLVDRDGRVHRIGGWPADSADDGSAA